MRNEPTWDEVNEWSVRKINKYFRSIDDSNLWPVCGRFNATERAIRSLRRDKRNGLCINDGLEYYLALEERISAIINGTKYN